ncbi:hypothetical protein [Dyella sp. S184]|uniref:hypothetical protein n=1 Tax=Dyella sp. S184 TaxID=1641862 RepID=UPI001C205D9E|nr:hypothetical protein [Dyella sp. S184]
MERSQVEPTNRGTNSLARVPTMLEVRPASDGFMVYDTDADEPIVRFRSRTEADELAATLQIQEVHAQLARWSVDAEQTVH